ncbi:hypothetical protein [Methylobacterium sp.]|uniref:hypothetical protein n=1 Tax=Methylobacterium sp. TaxID=409 RepID=UPI000C5DE4E5|nr:hypothetical protein [Methylobacterium sp.]MBP27856.1 hypothetical protein [Methylobacterium sp.]
MTALFSPPKINMPAPTVAAPTPMPDTQDPQVLEARKRALADAATRGGRASTLMGGGVGDTALGASGAVAAGGGTTAGDSYANSTLGGGR